MLTKFILPLGVLTFAVLLTPTRIEAYGAAHFGYTHVGPNGVYHTGRTVAAGPGGVYAGGHTSAYGYGGASYRGGAAYGRSYYGGGAYGGGYYGGYRYNSGYAGAAYRYGYR